MKRFRLGLIAACLTLAADQLSKHLIFAWLKQFNGMHEILPFFNLVTVHNRGISFGMGNDFTYNTLFFSILALSIVGILLFWLRKETKPLPAIGYGLVIGGALGNVIDRVLFGAVMDFLDFHLYDTHWPAFNIADSAIFIGVVLLVWDSIIHPEKGKNHES